jgi:hypothetical protein
VLGRHRDGSWLSTIGTLRVRVVDAQITVKTSDGTRTGNYRLITTLLDAHRYPAGELITLYHQRWEIETAYLELKSSILGGRVLRARTPDGIDQEVHALLVIYQLLRTAMVNATDSNPAPIPTGPASPPRSTPPATRSSKPPVSSLTRSSTWSALSAAPCWPTCCPSAGSG